jgi:enamine deaminase RidA (YjgF/YER057c/UK114 family)
VHYIGVAAPIGNTATPSKSQSRRQFLFLSGTPGLSPDGHLSDCFEGQSDQAPRNVFELLEHAGMGRENLVEVTQYLLRQEHMPSIRRFVPSSLETDMERVTDGAEDCAGRVNSSTASSASPRRCSRGITDSRSGQSCLQQNPRRRYQPAITPAILPRPPFRPYPLSREGRRNIYRYRGP